MSFISVSETVVKTKLDVMILKLYLDLGNTIAVSGFSLLGSSYRIATAHAYNSFSYSLDVIS